MVISTSDIGKKRSRSGSDASESSTSDQAKRRPRFETTTPHSQDTPAVFNAEGSLRQDIEPSGLPEESPSCSCPADQDKKIAITVIRATDVTLGLRRLPAGFFVVLRHCGLEWRTENKPSSVKQDAVEWNGPIPISSDMSATICVEVYASFEFQPMLGDGEKLRKLTVTVEKLLERSEKNSPFTFFPKDGDILSPCTSLFVTIERQKDENGGPSVSKVVGPHWSNTELRSGLEEATNWGHTALLRYQKHGEKQYLERSIKEFERALNICPLNHPCRAVTQSNLAFTELIRFPVERRDARLEVALRMYRDALSARPVGHPDRPATLIHMATAHLLRFQNRGNDAEKNQAQTLLEEALGSGCRESHASQAASALQKLLVGQDRGSTRPNRRTLVEPDPASRFTNEDLWIFNVQLLERFKRFGDLADLEQAIVISQQLVRSTPTWDDRYFMALGNFGSALLKRFNRLGELADLEGSISRLRDAIDFIPHGHPKKYQCLNTLGITLRARFDRLGEPRDIEEAISNLRDVVHLIPHDHPHEARALNNLGNSLIGRFERFGEFSDLEDAISRLRDAVDLTPHDHPDKPGMLNGLGCSLITRFKRLGELRDLEEGISRSRDAVDLTPYDHPDKPHWLNNLSIFFSTRFRRLGELEDLEGAISSQRTAVDLLPHGHPDKPGHLIHLGGSFRTRFERLGELSDLEDALSSQREAVDLTPYGHPHKPISLSCLGHSLFTRFIRFGELSDLHHAISYFREAVDLTPDGHPDKLMSLNNLGNSFFTRFERLGELSDLESAISRQRDVVDLTPHDHPNKHYPLNNLGNSLKVRFECLGELGDLEDAILSQREAVDRIPHGHPGKANALSNLGLSFLARFKHLGELSDLENSISSQRDAVGLTPRGHPDKPSRLSNLGTSFLTRFEHLGDLCDLEEAISRSTDAVALTPHGHPDKPGWLNNLGRSLSTRFERLGEPRDLDNAISSQRDAVDLTPHGHPKKSGRLNNLGKSLKIRFERFPERSRLEDAVSVFSCVASSPIYPIDDRFYASLEWILCACRIHHSSLLHAFSVVVDLIPQRAWIGSSLARRYQRLTEAANIVQTAAATALDAGFPAAAVEWLEQGRSVIWGELFQLRGSYEDLSAAYPEYARRLCQVSAELDRAGTAYEQSSSAISEWDRTSNTLQETSAGFMHPSSTASDHEAFPSANERALQSARESSKQAAAKQRQLAIERENLLREIRKLPGFEHFLRPKRFSQLRAAAHAGPVVILNTALARCDALIVLANVDHVIHVPLAKLTFERSANLQGILTKYVRLAREGKPESQDGGSWEHVLSPLWQSVVKPVLDALAISVPTDVDPPRIFWCPTGPLAFTPIHAAGLYDGQYATPGHKVFDLVVSSYVPTLSILSQLSDPGVAQGRDNLRLLFVRQPLSDGNHPLPGVATELGRIKDLVRKSPLACTTLLETRDGTVDEVLNLMKETDWVHFACHGVQDGLDSGLCLAHKRRLKLRELTALSRPRGGLAFLSACQTAKGEQKLSEEAIHMAAGMLFAGYGGVVGTMWSISDRLAPDVARDVYAQLFGKGTCPDYRDAARALHEATDGLRKRGVPFAEWIPFIHVGL